MSKTKYSAETINQILSMYRLENKSIRQIGEELGIPRSTVHYYIQLNSNSDTLRFTKRDFRNLVTRVKHLEAVVSVLQESRCTASAPLKERLRELERLTEYGYNVHVLCEALKVSRGTYYNHMRRGKKDNTWYNIRRNELKEQILKIYNDNEQRYGAPRITAVLRNQGVNTTPKLVKDLMIEMNLLCVRQYSKSTYAKAQQHTHNLIRKNFNPDAPNEVWVSDVTYYKFKSNHYYICVVIDLFSRMVISYSIGYRNSTALIKKAFISAYNTRRPNEELIFHSDRGANYRSKAFGKCLDNHNVVQSYSAPGTPTDNAVAEAFFSHFKQEELYRRYYHSEREFREAVDDYIVYYNETRVHKALRYKTPVRFEEAYYSGCSNN